MAKLLEGKILADNIKDKIKQEIESLKLKPVLASVQVGDDRSSEVYINSQNKVANALGIEFQLHKLAGSIRQQEFIDFVENLNNDKSVNGIIVQMPLPAHIDSKIVTQCITAVKDVEGINPFNLGQLLLGKTRIFPCTAAAAVELIYSTNVDLTGKEVVVVGRSAIVGKPVGLMLMDKNATITTCHSGTTKAGKLEYHIKNADVLVVAIGKAKMIKGDWIKEGAIVIDVGINKEENKIVGDVDFDSAMPKASFITPVPGGVGPLTVTMLMRNLLEATIAQK